MVLGAHVLLCMTKPDFLKKMFLLQKWRKLAKNWQKVGLFKIYWKIQSLIFFWIWPIMKVYIICCVVTQIPYFGKIWFLRYGPKFSWSIRLQEYYISRKKMMKKSDFLHVDTDSWKVEVDWIILGWAIVQMCVTLKIGCMSRRNEWNKLTSGVLIQIQES